MELTDELVKKETSCVTTNTLIRFAESRKLDINELLRDIPYPYAYLVDTHNWIAHTYTKMLYRRLADMLKDPNATYQAAIFSKKLQTLGIVGKIGRLFTGPEIAYKRCREISWKFNRIYRMEPIEVRPNHATIKVQYLPSFEPTKLGCRYTEGILAVAPTHWLLPKADIKELQCQAEGAESCVYDIRFQEKRGFIKNFWYLTFGKAHRLQEALSELENSYETMERQRDELLDLNTTLEQKVAERTEQNKLLLVELSELEKLRFTQHLLAKARHELNNPLTVLASAVGRIAETYQACRPGVEPRPSQDNRITAKWDETLTEIEKVYNLMDSIRPVALNLDTYRKSIDEVLAGKEANKESLRALSNNLAALVSGARNLEEQMDASTQALADFRGLLDRLEPSAPGALPGRLDSELESGLTTVKTEISNMVGVIGTISQFAKVGKYIPGKEKIELKSFLEQYANRYRTKFEEHGIEFRVQSATEAYVKTDQSQLFEVFDNLFNNSIEAKAKTIEVGIRKKEMPGGAVYNEIEVTDNGVGFKPEDKESIFLPFSSTKGGKLSGVGLGIVKSIINTNKGFVDCDAKPGEGASFYITLPPYEK